MHSGKQGFPDQAYLHPQHTQHTTQYTQDTHARNKNSTHLEVVLHARVVRESGAGGPDLRPHVADCAHAGARDGVHAGAEVLHDGARPPLDGQDAGHLEDDVLGRRPARELARKLHTDHLVSRLGWFRIVAEDR